MQSIRPLALLLALSALAFAQAPAQQAAGPARQAAGPTPPPARPMTPVYTESLDRTHVLIGPLGRPLGEMLSIAAVVDERVDSKDWFHNYVSVTQVNGVPLARPVRMPAQLWQWGNLKELKPGERLKLRVYQTGAMMGVPDQAMRETVYVQTSAHSFVTWLVVVNETK